MTGDKSSKNKFNGTGCAVRGTRRAACGADFAIRSLYRPAYPQTGGEAGGEGGMMDQSLLFNLES
jgi:hypothetical protein